MAGFKDIVGNEQIIEHLQNAISMGKVSHAYIINGPQLSGKMMIWTLCLPKFQHTYDRVPNCRAR